MPQRGERLALLDHVHGVQPDRLVEGAFVVDGAVGIRRGLASVQDLFGLAVHVQPEIAVDDVRHGHTGMRVPAGPGAAGDVDRGDDEL
jgi:hypothetical protein